MQKLLPKLNAFQLKWIAIIGMITNHIVIGLWSDSFPTWLAIPLYAAGGLTFPIMAYFVVEGYKHTRSLGKYIGRLAIFGLIALPFHMLTMGSIMLNILFTIIVGLFCLWLYDKLAKMRWLFWIIFVIICILTMFPISFDWPLIGVIVVMLTYAIKNETTRRVVPSVVAGLFILLNALSMVWMLGTPGMEDMIPLYGFDLRLAWVSMSFFIGNIAAALLLYGFNGERGRRMKWAFYVIYPVHLAIIGLTALALGIVTLAQFGINV
ncbi:MAG: conjugal transfer protein TraX [Oscillospiraceae bacterium]|nr:conjugal transfer protein TraX [Oscillospiraceae bacterium]